MRTRKIYRNQCSIKDPEFTVLGMPQPKWTRIFMLHCEVRGDAACDWLRVNTDAISDSSNVCKTSRLGRSVPRISYLELI
jgi:hypothetical protein